jgi:hypothetical protein
MRFVEEGNLQSAFFRAREKEFLRPNKLRHLSNHSTCFEGVVGFLGIVD